MTSETLPPEERAEYLAAWREYKLLRNVTWIGFALLLIFLLIAARHRSEMWNFFAGAVFIVLLPANIALQRWKCPRCGKRFSGGLIRVGWQQQPWIRSCYWCYLTKSELAALQRTIFI
jgi:hypothetical protein